MIGVNLLVFPISSERELRQTLVLSLDHIGTFSHLLAKTYTLSISDEERQIRDQLNQTIRVRHLRLMPQPVYYLSRGSLGRLWAAHSKSWRCRHRDQLLSMVNSGLPCTHHSDSNDAALPCRPLFIPYRS